MDIILALWVDVAPISQQTWRPSRLRGLPKSPNTTSQLSSWKLIRFTSGQLHQRSPSSGSIFRTSHIAQQTWLPTWLPHKDPAISGNTPNYTENHPIDFPSLRTPPPNFGKGIPNVAHLSTNMAANMAASTVSTHVLLLSNLISSHLL